MEFIGKYRIIKRLGGGGFGDVYLGHDAVMQRDVAIKVFNPKDENLLAFAMSSDAEALQVLRARFLREARILARLDESPHIINVIEFGEQKDGAPWYAMPYVPRSLAGELGKDVFDQRAMEELPETKRPRALALDVALAYLSQIIAGLATAHEAGLVHRDIKPSNILLTESNQVRIADFGVAKAPDGIHSMVSHLGIGSRNYMAPEQRESAKHVDARADVYSLGVLAYRMITARLPSGRYADPNVHVPALGKSLNEVLLAAMAEDVEARPKDAGMLLQQWQAALQARAKEGIPDGSDTSTSTRVEPLRKSSAPDRLQPLVELVEKTLLEHGHLDPTKSEIAAMAQVLGLDETRQKALVEEIREKNPQLVLVDNLQRIVVERARQYQKLDEAEFDDLLAAAELAGKDREWLNRQFAALLPQRTELPVVKNNQEAPTEQIKPAVTKSESTTPAKGVSSNWPIIAVAMVAVALIGLLLFGDSFSSRPKVTQIPLDMTTTPQPEPATLSVAPIPSDRTRTNAGKVDENAAQLARLARQFTGHIGNHNLSTGESGSALETLNKMRALGLSPAKVDEYKTRLADAYASLADSAIQRHELSEAASYIEEGGSIRVTEMITRIELKLRESREADAEALEQQRIAMLAEQKTKTPGRVFRDRLKGGGEGPEMVIIPAGSFRMGDLSGEGDDDEKLVHTVQIGKVFAMGKYELTFAEYDRYASATGKSEPGDQGWGRDNRPLINVSWDDAQGYVTWLSVQTGKHYRLPSESEWEYAARGGSTTKYSWGNSISCADARYGYYSHGCGKQGSTDFVGSFPANSFGLHDMHGNVWEWVEDCWHESYRGAPADGSAWTRSGDCAQRVLRGGAWLVAPRDLRSAHRYWVGRGFRYGNFGVRVVRDL